MIKRLDREFVTQARSALSTVQNRGDLGGYEATADMEAGRDKNKSITGGQVEIETNSEIIGTLEETMEWSVVKALWPKTHKIFSTS